MTTVNSCLDDQGRLVSADRISAIDAQEVFVFGANADGRHGAGAARVAQERFGARSGVGDGPTGQSYAIDTMSGEGVMADAIARFVEHAARHPERVFLVTAIGTGIAGHSVATVASYFGDVPANVALPASFWDALPSGPTSNYTAHDGGRLVTAPRIAELADGEIFVFGASASAQHGGGAARVARDRFGAVVGRGHGPQGRSYAIGTMGGLAALRSEVEAFVEYATARPELTFLVTALGTGTAGFHVEQVAPLFGGAPANVALPASFLAADPALHEVPRAG